MNVYPLESRESGLIPDIQSQTLLSDTMPLLSLCHQAARHVLFYGLGPRGIPPPWLLKMDDSVLEPELAPSDRLQVPLKRHHLGIDESEIVEFYMRQ